MAFDFSFISSIIFFNRFSKSPLYFDPARRAPISNDSISVLDNDSCALFSEINLANPSTIAVLPTPVSPTNKGLFFLRLDRT